MLLASEELSSGENVPCWGAVLSVRSDQMFDLMFLVFMDRSTSLEESIKSMSLNPEEDDIPWKDLRDNRDLTVLFNWDPKDR